MTNKQDQLVQPLVNAPTKGRPLCGGTDALAAAIAPIDLLGLIGYGWRRRQVA